MGWDGRRGEGREGEGMGGAIEARHGDLGGALFDACTRFPPFHEEQKNSSFSLLKRGTRRRAL